MKDNTRHGLIALLALLDLAWAVVAFGAMMLADAFDYGDAYETWWRTLVLLAVAAAPWVVLARTGWRRVGLAYGVLLLGAVVFFGVCVVGA